MRALRRIGWLVLGHALVFAGAAALYAAGPNSQGRAGGNAGPVLTGTVGGRGGWTVHPRAHGQPDIRGPRIPAGPAASRRWEAQLTRHADKSVTGDIAIEVAGQRLVSNGRVRGRAEHGRIWGEILDDQGRQAVTFEGTIGAGGVQGTFTASNDETGTFSWEGTIPTPEAE